MNSSAPVDSPLLQPIHKPGGHTANGQPLIFDLE